jgi:hypothetical protein
LTTTAVLAGDTCSANARIVSFVVPIVRQVGGQAKFIRQSITRDLTAILVVWLVALSVGWLAGWMS